MSKRSFVWPAVIFSGIVVLLFVLGYSFFPVWRKGDNGAEAYGAFLSYAATSIALLVTLVYVFLTLETLKTAHESIALQREQWAQHLRADPQFWLIERAQPRTNPKLLTHGMGAVVSYRHILDLYIWNSAEQSFRITAVEITAQGTSSPIIVRTQGFVVKGQSLEKIDTDELNDKLAQVFIDLGCASNHSKELRLNIRLHYRTWERGDRTTDSTAFLVKTAQRLEEISIVEVET